MSLAARTGLFAIYSLGLMVAYFPVLRSLVELSREDSSASHLILVPFVTLALVYQSRAEISASGGLDWRRGLAVIGLGGAGLLAAVISGFQDALPALAASFVVIWVGGFLLVFGRAAFRAVAFPLCFLAFMIPVPTALLDGVIRLLTIGSSEAVAGLFALTGTPYHREGFVFALPNLTIEIADECSGIRSTIALGLTSLLAGHLYLRRGWSKAFLAGAILPITILKNGIRIVTLSLLSIHVDPVFLQGRLHHDGGVLFFLLALVLLAPVLLLLRRFEATRERAAARTPVSAATGVSGGARAVVSGESQRELTEGPL